MPQENAENPLVAAVDNQARLKCRARVQAAITSLLADCSPETTQAVHSYLDRPDTAPDKLVEAFAKAGRNDRSRTPRINVERTARTTGTAWGIACLIAYCRAWLDTDEQMFPGPAPAIPTPAVAQVPEDHPSARMAKRVPAPAAPAEASPPLHTAHEEEQVAAEERRARARRRQRKHRG